MRPYDAPNLQRELVVKDVMDMLQLGHVQASMVGGSEKRGISGGQRKRVNIGMELAASPSILFMDEPTSGLDSTSTAAITDALREFAALGVLIAAVIHQPRFSVFSAFDDCLLLAPGGRTVYLGPTSFATEYFRKELNFRLPQFENPADWLMDVVSGVVPRPGFPSFIPQHLPSLWMKVGQNFVAKKTGKPVMTQEVKLEMEVPLQIPGEDRKGGMVDSRGERGEKEGATFFNIVVNGAKEAGKIAAQAATRAAEGAAAEREMVLKKLEERKLQRKRAEEKQIAEMMRQTDKTLTTKQMQAIESVFNEIDVNNDGTVTKRELHVYFQRKFEKRSRIEEKKPAHQGNDLLAHQDSAEWEKIWDNLPAVDLDYILPDLGANEIGEVDLRCFLKFVLRMSGRLSPVQRQKANTSRESDGRSRLSADSDAQLKNAFGVKSTYGVKRSTGPSAAAADEEIAVPIDQQEGMHRNGGESQPMYRRIVSKVNVAWHSSARKVRAHPTYIKVAQLASSGRETLKTYWTKLFQVVSETYVAYSIWFEERVAAPTRLAALKARRQETGYYWPKFPNVSIVYASVLHYTSALIDLFCYAALADTTELPPEAKRGTSGVVETLRACGYRAIVQMFRSLDYYAFSIFVTVSATVVIGALNGVSERLYLVPSDAAMPMCILGLMSAVQGLYTFLPERLTTFREARSGASWTNMSVFFIAKSLVDLIPVTITSAIFSFIFYEFAQYRSSVVYLFTASWVASYTSFGFAYLCGFILSPSKTMLGTSVLLLVSGAFFQGINPSLADNPEGSFTRRMMNLTFSRWSLEYIAIHEYRSWESSYNDYKTFGLSKVGYCGVSGGVLTVKEAIERATHLDFMSTCDPTRAIMNGFWLGTFFRAAGLTVLLIRSWLLNKYGY